MFTFSPYWCKHDVQSVSLFSEQARRVKELSILYVEYSTRCVIDVYEKVIYISWKA